MEIYVQSCGIAQEHDYRWLKIPQQGTPYPEIPRILKEASRIDNGSKVRLTDLYESQEPTLMIARDKGELLLLVTALEAVERTKVYRRQVRNSVAWVTEDTEENKQLFNKIATQAKQEWEYLRKVIDGAVDFDDQNGFIVNRELIQHYVEYVDYVEDVDRFEEGDREYDFIRVSSPQPKIAEIYWNLIDDNKPNTKLAIYFSFLSLIILLLVIVLTFYILTGNSAQEPPFYETPSPSPTSQM